LALASDVASRALHSLGHVISITLSS
jgi:hypothetical protein